jgi:predicted nucleic acid-binding protein
MALIVDSAIYIEHLRGSRDIRGALKPFVRSGELYNCGVVRAEVLRGIKNPRFRLEMEAFFDVVPEIPTDAKMWRQVSALAWQLDRNGSTLPLADLVIACCALRIDAAVITTDGHFSAVPGLRVRPDLPSTF